MLPPWFFHYLKPIPVMATAKKSAELPAAAAPEVVYLRSEDLGETRAFMPAHAQALLAYQESKGYAHWQPAEAPAEGDKASE